jgi:S-formylglutathione hydrolase FrmB
MKRVLVVFIVLSGLIFAQDKLVIDAKYIPYPDTTLIIVPADYETVRMDYPLVFLLHGWAGNYNQWNENIDLQEYADNYEFIIVCPDAFYDSWYLDSPIKKEWQFERFFWNVLSKKILADYRVDRKNIFISGLSMGGHGALTLFFKNLDFFRAAGSTSGILDLTKFPGKWGIEKVLGKYSSNPHVWKKNSADYLVGNMLDSEKKIIFDCGTEDFAYSVNAKFKEECENLMIDHKFISGPGNHSHSYWKKSIKWHFDFFKQNVVR